MHPYDPLPARCAAQAESSVCAYVHACMHAYTHAGVQLKLTELSVPNNALSGAVPSELGNLRWLKVLDLSSNNLTGTLPDNMDGEDGDLPLFQRLQVPCTLHPAPCTLHPAPTLSSSACRFSTCATI